MRVFVTGATGYIGGSIAVRLVRDGHEVAGLTRSAKAVEALADLGIKPVIGTLDEKNVLAREANRADAVINAADSDHRGAVETFIEVLAGSGKAFLHSSGSTIVSDDARGEAAYDVFTEADIQPATGWQPTSDKAARVAVDRLALEASKQNVRSIVLCNSLIYGYGRGLSRDSVQIPRLVAQAKATGVVRHIGSGSNIWSTVHIDDVVDLYSRALVTAPAGSFYFVENGEASFKDMTQAIAETLGLGKVQSWEIDSAIKEWGYERAMYALGSNSRVRGIRARAELGWTPEYDSVISWIHNELTI